MSRRVALRRDDLSSSAPVASRAPDFAGTNVYSSDPVLMAALDPVLDEPAEETLKALGAYWGSVEAQEVARIAACHRPHLRREDYEGRPIDQLDLHPAFHALMNRSITSGLTSSAWEDGEDKRQHRLRAATLYLTAQCERGHLTGICATHAGVAALAYAPELESELFPLVAARRYDRKPLPLGEKDGATIALALAERGAAEPSAVAMRGEIGGGDRVRLWGEKWFVAAPTSDMLLVLARTSDGPTAAMVPRYAAENVGTVRINGLKALPGLASQAVASVGFEGSVGRLVGEPGRGLQVLRDVRTLTQLDLALIGAACLRSAVARAAHHARTRQSHGKLLIADPLTERVVADLALDSAAMTALSLRLATAFDQAFERDGDHAIARLVTPAARFQTLKLAPGLLAEAADLIGPQAGVDTHPMARVVADVHALAQWDGSASDAAHELATLVGRDPTVLADGLDELAVDLGEQNADLVDETLELGRRAAEQSALARAFAEQLALIAAAAALRRSMPRAVADTYIATRLRERYRTAYGALDGRFDAAALIDFIAPED